MGKARRHRREKRRTLELGYQEPVRQGLKRASPLRCGPPDSLQNTQLVLGTVVSPEQRWGMDSSCGVGP